MTLFASRAKISRDDASDRFKKEKDYRLRERYHAIYMSYCEYTCEQIAEILVREISTVRTWIKEFNANGYKGLERGKGTGRPRKLAPDQEDDLKKK